MRPRRSAQRGRPACASPRAPPLRSARAGRGIAAAASAGRGPQVSAWLPPALLAAALLLALGAYGVWRGAPARPRALLPLEAALQRPGADPAADAAGARAGSFRSRSPTSCAATSGSAFESPPPTAPRRSFCAICSTAPIQRWPPSRAAVGISASMRPRQIRRHVAHPAEHGSRCTTARDSCARPPARTRAAPRHQADER